MIPHWLIYTLLGIFLIGTSIWAFRSDKKQDIRLGKRALENLGEPWRLKGKLKQSQSPFYHAMPSESSSFMRLSPVLSGEIDGSTVWLFGNPTNHHTVMSIGSSVMVAVPIEWPYSFSLRLHPYKLGEDWKRQVWDSRFDLIDNEYAHHRWWLCATEKSELAEAVARRIVQEIKTDAVRAIQIGNGYLVTSCGTMYREENYLRAWEATEKIWNVFRDLRLPAHDAELGNTATQSN